ncbi:MAG TPA: N-acetyltransferase [Pyrodictium sp.]|nr:N-acetyltransferase [Pyrodictium sp.]
MQCCKTVRAAEPQDLNAAFMIEIESFENPYPRWYFDLLYGLSGGKYFLVSTNDRGEITGYIIGIPLSGNVCHIASIAVVKQCRRKGVGTALLHSLLELCSADGYTSFILEVDVYNYVAQRLYASNLFKPVMVVADYYGRGRHALVMILLNEIPCCI